MLIRVRGEYAHGPTIGPDNTSSPLGRTEKGQYQEIKGFCKSATLDETRKHKHVLTPGRHYHRDAVPVVQ